MQITKRLSLSFGLSLALSICFSFSALADVTLKALVVNPSKFKTQTATMKAYFPMEVKPEDIIDPSDLKIDYDVDKGLYYAFKDIELAPGETASRSIKIKDIWIIPQTDVELITQRARDLVKQLKDNPNFNQAVQMQKEIEEEATQLLRKQEMAQEALPQRHIATYRDNLETITLMKSLLATLEKMAQESKATTGVSVGRISIKASWWVILGVILGLSVLSGFFFVFWHRQAAIEEARQRQKEQAQEEELPQLPQDEEQNS